MVNGRKSIGVGTEIDPSVEISKTVDLELGDQVYVGPDVKIIGFGKVKFGDYTKIHRGCFINCASKHVIFGHNTWIGERVVLDGTGGLTAGNNIGVGIASHLYTHIAHGDVMAGCRFKSDHELIIGDDAWFVGQCLVSPVTVGEKAMAMLGSTIVKDMLPNHVYAGIPATDITDKTGAPWEFTPAEKRLKMFSDQLQEFSMLNSRAYDHSGYIKAVSTWPSNFDVNVSYFNVMTREYTKRRSDPEIAFMKWLTSWKGRFTPVMITDLQGRRNGT